jgi:signal peptidase II
MNHRGRAAIIIAIVVLLDRLTKLWIVARFSPWDMLPVIPGVFNIVHAENPGAAFSMLAESPAIVRALVLVGISVSVMMFVGWMLWRAPDPQIQETPWMRTALALVFGGAAGNLIDRVFRGTVTDFLQVFIGSYEFPAFNVADGAITIGAALMVIDLIRTQTKTHRTDHGR